MRVPCGCNALRFVFFVSVLSTLLANATPSTLLLVSLSSASLPVEGLSVRRKGKQVSEGGKVAAFSTGCTEGRLGEKRAVVP